MPGAVVPRLLPYSTIFKGAAINKLFGGPVIVTNMLNSSRKTLAKRVYFRRKLNGIACNANSSMVIGVNRGITATPQKLIASVNFTTLKGIFCTFRKGVRYANNAVG